MTGQKADRKAYDFAGKEQKQRKEYPGNGFNRIPVTRQDSYADIRNLPRHVSKVHPPMPRANRAAQFMPFSALSGYEEAVQETARQTEAFRELDEDRKRQLDEKLAMISQMLSDKKEVQVTIMCFVPDVCKDGGNYREYSGVVKRIDPYRKEIVLTDGTSLRIRYISDIQMEETEK